MPPAFKKGDRVVRIADEKRLVVVNCAKMSDSRYLYRVVGGGLPYLHEEDHLRFESAVDQLGSLADDPR